MEVEMRHYNHKSRNNLCLWYRVHNYLCNRYRREIKLILRTLHTIKDSYYLHINLFTCFFVGGQLLNCDSNTYLIIVRLKK